MYTNFEGWDRKGITRCNVLVNAIKIHRECDENKETEIEMKLRYAKNARNLNGDNNGDSNNTDMDDSDSGDLEVHDSFSGGLQLSQATSITEV